MATIKRQKAESSPARSTSNKFYVFFFSSCFSVKEKNFLFLQKFGGLSPFPKGVNFENWKTADVSKNTMSSEISGSHLEGFEAQSSNRTHGAPPKDPVAARAKPIYLKT